MKSKVLSLFMSLALFLSVNLATTQKAEALVGKIIRSSTISTFGSIALKGGGAATVGGLGAGLILAATVPSTAYPWLGFLITVGGIYTMAFGLIILDDDTALTIDYLPIENGSNEYHKYTQSEIDTYNLELEELNAIKNSIQEEIELNSTEKDLGQKLWVDYSKSLSPATIKIAQDKAIALLKSLKK